MHLALSGSNRHVITTVETKIITTTMMKCFASPRTGSVKEAAIRLPAQPGNI